MAIKTKEKQMSRTITMPKEERTKVLAVMNALKFACMECGKKFRSTKAAERASSNGCPTCGGCDIDAV